MPSIFSKRADLMSRRLKLTEEWKLNPILFQSCSLRDTTNIFVCDKSQHSAQKVCTKNTRPSECCNRRVQCPVVRPSVLCISSLQSDHEMCAKDKRSEGENPASNPGMAIRTLVPSCFLSYTIDPYSFRVQRLRYFPHPTRRS